MLDSPAPALPAEVTQLPGLAPALLTMSLTAVAVLRPRYDSTQQVIDDFDWVYLNPAGQRMLQQPATPAASLLTLFPTAKADGVFDVCCQAFATGEMQRNETYYQADGLDGYFVLVAQRTADLLLVNFTDTNEQSRSAAEQALRESQARERAARNEAEAGRQQLFSIFEQAPAMICIFDGPEHVFQFVNSAYQALVGERPLLGKPIAQAMPELAGQPIFALLDRVYQTGEPFHATEMLVQLDHHNEGKQELEKRYYNFIYQARRDAAEAIDGILVFAYEVTPQVIAREQVQHLNEELAARNDEYQQANAALLRTEQQLRHLNEELEARVQERTGRLAEQQRLLSQILGQVPAAIATLSGSEHRFSFFNDDYQRIVAGRAHLGQRVADAVPEVVEQGFIALLDNVLATGDAFVSRAVPAQLHDPASGQLVQHYVDLSYQQLVDAHGQATGILAFVVDVTEGVLARRQTETLQEALLAQARHQAQQRQELFQVFEQTPVAIVLLREPDHRIDYYNPAFRDVFPPEEWTGGSLQGHRVEEVYPRLKLAGLTALLDRVYATGDSETILDLPLSTLQPGSPRHLTLTYQAYREQDRIVGVAAFAYDTTEQVHTRQQVQTLNEELAAINEELTGTNEELLESNARLTRTNTDLDTFVYTASHDLKAPIANMDGLLLALRKQLAAAEVAHSPLVVKLLDLMQESIGRFQQTIGHLTNIGQLQRVEAPAEVDLRALVDDVRQDLAPLELASHATLTLDLDQCPTVRCSPKTLRSVVYNLLSNALKYQAPDRAPEVQVRCHPRAGHLVLEVQDNGLGLTEAQQAKLFRMFERQHAHVEGSGVGLYMVKRLVENARGTITVRSQLGVGSTFTVSLPV